MQAIKEIWLVLTCIALAKCFNVDTQNPIVLETGHLSPKLFGQSIVLDMDKAVVGAPESNKHGDLFQCAFDSNAGGKQHVFCSSIGFADEMTWTDHTNFLGYNLAKTSRDFAVSCAFREPRATKFTTFKSEAGTCYKVDMTARFPQIQLRYKYNHTPLINQSGWELVSVMGSQLLATNDDGIVFSAPYARSNRFIWGAERMMGTIIKEKFGTLNIANGSWCDSQISNKQDPHVQDLAGSSIEKGAFYATDKRVEHFAIGAPKANSLLGQVHICFDCFSEKRPRDLDLILEGQQIGARFGEALAAVDLNGDGYDDLVVGAPLFSTKNEFDVGKAYVYRSHLDHLGRTVMELIDRELPRPLKVSGSRFGSAVANVGDLQNDGYQDFAIGAPYDGDNLAGVVYIYRGRPDFKFHEEQPQIITPQALKMTVNSGFGGSFSKERVDIDNNGFPDFAIGAPLSDRAVVLRSIPVAVFSPNSEVSAPDVIDPKINEFEISLSIGLRKSIAYAMKATVETIIDSRAKFERGSNFSVQFPEGQEFLNERLKVTANNPSFGVSEYVLAIPRPIDIELKIHWALDDPGKPCPIPGCPMIDPRLDDDLPEVLKTRVKLQSGCKNPERCQCSLRIKKTDDTTESTKEYVAGSNMNLDLAFAIWNDGTEPSYKAALEFTSNIQLPLQNDCFEEGDSPYTMKCNLPPMLGKSSQNVQYNFPLQNVEVGGQPEYSVQVRLLDQCFGQSNSMLIPDRIGQTINYEYEIDTKVIVDKNQLGFNQNNMSFEHVYRVTNLGPSTSYQEAIARIYVPIASNLAKLESLEPAKYCNQTPHFTTNEYNNGAPIAKFSNPVACSTKKCYVFQCSLPNPWRPGETIEIKPRILFFSELAHSDKDHVSFAMFTHFQTSLNSADMSHAVTEMFSVQDGVASVLKANWPIGVGCAVVIVFVGLVVLALYKTNTCGKLRIFKSKIDEEEDLLNKRKSQLPQS